MRKLFMILACSLFLNTSSYAQDWTAAVAKVSKSMVRVATDGRVCAGFSINEQAGNILTAHHCIEDDTEAVVQFTINGKASYLVEGFPEQDLAVVWTVDKIRALKPRVKPLKPGLSVAAMGFAYTIPTLHLQAGQIASLRAPWVGPGPWMTTNIGYIRGMSGGPVFDQEGRVVAVVQKIFVPDDQDPIGLDRPLNEIMRLTRKYWR